MLVAVPPIEAWIDHEDKKYNLSVAVPGVDPKEIQVNVQGNNLTVSGEQEREGEKGGRLSTPRVFSWTVRANHRAAGGVDTQKLTAEYNNGILEIAAPLSASALPKRIEVKASTKAKGAGA